MIIFVQTRLREVVLVSDITCAARVNRVVVLTCEGSKCNAQVWRLPPPIYRASGPQGTWLRRRGGEKKVSLKSCCISRNSTAGQERKKKTGKKKKKSQKRREAQQQWRGWSGETEKQATPKRGQEWTVWLKWRECLFFWKWGSSSFVLPVAVVLNSCLALHGGADGGGKVQTSPGHRLRLLHGDLDFGGHHVH